jgi:hypothetical protein
MFVRASEDSIPSEGSNVAVPVKIAFPPPTIGAQGLDDHFTHT